MSRLLAGLLGAALLAALPSAAQDKKEPPKKKERVAVADPKDAANDPDFAIQGEYEGTPTAGAVKPPIAAQVIARGLGEFDVKLLAGGLPGAGWDGKGVIRATARRGESGPVEVAGPNLSGTIAGGKLTVKQGLMPEVSFTKVVRKSPTLGAKPPAGAAVLFGGPGGEKNWDGGKLVELSDGAFLNVGVKSRQKFGAFTAHVEFRTPWMPNSSGQGRGNSGVYLQDRYELQVLDSFGLKGENNECGGIYTQHKPKVNMCLPPLVWQTYDIDFTPARFEGDKKVKNGRATIRHNGVVIHDDVEFPKECPGGQTETADPGPFQFQNHGDPVVYNNVWVAEAK
ncbi:MAG: DUF1080 domain-containing protein [Gemmataceae bacterium]|nr:DUF1080 domain-containing protein [Gemmataceae bacterium]